MSTTREPQQIRFPLYYAHHPWTLHPYKERYEVMVTGTPTGKHGTGDTWLVDNVFITPRLPDIVTTKDWRQLWREVLPLIERQIKQHTDRSPRGLLLDKLEQA